MMILTPVRRLFGRLPFAILMLCAAVLAYWAVRLLAPLPAPLPAAPLAVDAAPAAARPAELWQNEAGARAESIKVLAIIGSPSGRGRAVLEVDGKALAGSTGEELRPGWRVAAVRPDAVDLEIDGKIRRLSQPLPAAGQEISIAR